MAESDPGSTAADSMRPAGRSEAKTGDSSQRVRGSRRVIQVDNFKSLLVAWILIGPEIAAWSLPLPGFAKGVLVGALAVAGSFWLGWLLVRHTKLGNPVR
jgi:hypothetical protein